MAFGHGTNADFYVNGFDATGFCDSVSQDGSIDTAEVTTLGKTAKNYIPGLEDATISFSGFYDTQATDSTAFSYKLNALRRTITEATYIPQVDVVGNPSFFVQGELTKYKVETPVDDAGTFESEFQSNTGFERGVSLHILSAETVTNAGFTSVDQTASSANGASALLQVTAATGTTPSLTVVVQHSTDNSTFADLITFGAKTTGGVSERGSAVGTVNRYVRVRWTISGTTPSFTFHVAFSRK